MTSEKQTSLFTEDKSTCYPGGSPASRSAQQDKEREQRMTDTSGRKCLERYGKLPRATLWGKTFMALLIGQGDWYSTRCRLIWKMKGTKSYRLYFQLAVKTRPTEGIEFGLLPTPDTSDRRSDKSSQWGLTNYARNQLLPTPNSMDYVTMPNRKDNNLAEGGRHGVSLHHLSTAGLLPTPMAADLKGGSTKRKGNSQLTETLGVASQLNPRFVLEMMGFPPNWTELPFLNGETNQSKQQETQSCHK